MARSEWIARAALIPFGLLIAVVALEAALQVGALVVRADSDAPDAGWSGGQRVLTLGDSNTYGVRLQDRGVEAYPAQLEALWNERHPERPIEVLNAGYPGTNSSQLVRDLPEMVETFQPDLLVVMVGVNDSWTEPVAVGERPEPSTGWQWLEDRSRVLRLLRLLGRRLGAGDLEVVEGTPQEVGQDGQGVVRFGDREIPMGWTRSEGAPPAWRRTLGANLDELAERARALGVELVLMSYPSRHVLYRTANIEIRRAADRNATPLIDLEAEFAPVCPRKECPEWFYPDYHPRAVGHGKMAEAVVSALGSEPGR